MPLYNMTKPRVLEALHVKLPLKDILARLGRNHVSVYMEDSKNTNSNYFSDIEIYLIGRITEQNGEVVTKNMRLEELIDEDIIPRNINPVITLDYKQRGCIEIKNTYLESSIKPSKEEIESGRYVILTLEQSRKLARMPTAPPAERIHIIRDN